MNMDTLLPQLQTLAITQALPFLMKVIAALVLWFVGRSAINVVQRVLHIALERRKLDNTLIGYVESLASGSLTMLLLLAILGMMGVETTSFAAVLAAAGIAIGTAWSGLLSNFAAGVFLLVLRPFHVGDDISSGGVGGKVKEIGLFVTSLETPDALRISVGNSRLLGDNIINYTFNSHRRLVLKVPLWHGSDVHALIRALEARLTSVPGVQATPAPAIEVAEFTLYGPVLAVQVWCDPRQADPVQAATQLAMQEALMAAGYTLPPQATQALAKAS
jgi:small conductance mechanosensitive channel